MHDDLRLLNALDVLLEERSVGAAAEQLHLSQPAMSRTLGRIRAATGDAILVRSGTRMLPTPYAEEVRDEVRALVERGHAVLTPARTVDPAALTRRFRLRVNDALATAIVPTLAVAIREEAPNVVFSVLAESDAEDTADDVDASLGSDVLASASLRHEVLGVDTLVTVGMQAPINAAAFAAADHVVVTRRGRTTDLIDDALTAHGLQRRVVLTVPTVAAALAAVDGTGLITVVPSVTARALRADHVPLPFDIEAVPSVMTWHARFDADPAERWFRRVVARTVQDALR